MARHAGPVGLRRQTNHALHMAAGHAGSDNYRSPEGVPDQDQRLVSRTFKHGNTGQQVQDTFGQDIWLPVVQT